MYAWEHFGMDVLAWRAEPLDARLMMCAALFLGGSYTRKGQRASSPFRLPGAPWLPTGKDTVCSTMTGAILTAAYPEKPWSKGDWMDIQIGDPSRLDSPMDVVERHGIGRRVNAFENDRWHLVQGWRSLDPLSGHAFLVRGVGDRALLLQSSSLGLRGPTLDLIDPADVKAKYSAKLFIAALT